MRDAQGLKASVDRLHEIWKSTHLDSTSEFSESLRIASGGALRQAAVSMSQVFYRGVHGGVGDILTAPGEQLGLVAESAFGNEDALNQLQAALDGARHILTNPLHFPETVQDAVFDQLANAQSAWLSGDMQATGEELAELHVAVLTGVSGINGAGATAVKALYDRFGVDLDALDATDNVPNLVIDTKIQTQMTNRGWSRQNVDDVIADGPTGRTTDNRRPNKTDDGLGRDDTATVYGSSGNYVVVNDRTGEIVQVCGRNDPSWIDDGRIQWD